MTTTDTTQTHRAVNLAGVSWVDNGRRAAFAAARPGYGVEVIATGQVLSSDGVQPSAWRTKAAAAVHAQYPGTHYTPVTITR